MSKKYSKIFIFILAMMVATFGIILPQEVMGEGQNTAPFLDLKKEALGGEHSDDPSKRQEGPEEDSESSKAKKSYLQKLTRLKETLTHYQNKVLVSGSEKAKDLYEKVLKGEKIVENLYQQKKYKVALKYLEDIEGLTKEIDSLIKDRKDTLDKMSKLKVLLEEWERKISSFEAKETEDLFKQTKSLSGNAQELIEKEKYGEACQRIELAEEYFEEASEFFKERKLWEEQKDKALKETSRLKEILAQVKKEKLLPSKDKVDHQLEQAEQFIQEADKLIEKKYYQEALGKAILAEEHLTKIRKLSEKEEILAPKEKIKSKEEIKEKDILIKKEGQGETIEKKDIVKGSDKVPPSAKVTTKEREEKALPEKRESLEKVSAPKEIKDNSFQKLEEIESRLKEYKDEVLKSGCKETIDLYHKALESKAAAKILFKQEKYDDTLKYLKDMEDLTRRIDFLIKCRRDALCELTKLNKLLESRKEILSSKDSKARDYYSQAEQLSKVAEELIKDSHYEKASKEIGLANEYINEANILFFFNKEKKLSEEKEDSDKKGKVLGKIKSKEEIKEKDILVKKEEQEKAVEKKDVGDKSDKVPPSAKVTTKEREEKALPEKRESLEKVSAAEEVKDKAFQKLKEIDNRLKQYKDKTIKSKSKEVKILYKKALKAKAMAKELFQQKKYNTVLNLLEDAEGLIRKIESLAEESIYRYGEESCKIEESKEVDTYTERDIEKELAKWSRAIEHTEEMAKKSSDEQVLIFLWEVKELYLKARTNYHRGRLGETLSNIQKMATLISKANDAANTFIDLANKIEFKVAHLDEMISKVEGCLRREVDEEKAKKIKAILWKAKECRLKSNVFLARNEKKKTLLELDKGIACSKEALSYVEKGEKIDIKETAHLKLIKLSDLISKAEDKVKLDRNSQAKDILVDARRVERIAQRCFDEGGYRKAIEGAEIGIKLVYKAKGITPDGEEGDTFKLNKLTKEIRKLEEILDNASSNYGSSLEVREYLKKAVNLHREAVISLYADKDYRKAEVKINKALEYASLILGGSKKKNPDRIIQEKIEKGRILIEEARKEVSLRRDKEAQKALALSEAYFLDAYNYYKHGDFQKSMENLEFSKLFALKAMERADE